MSTHPPNTTNNGNGRTLNESPQKNPPAKLFGTMTVLVPLPERMDELEAYLEKVAGDLQKALPEGHFKFEIRVFQVIPDEVLLIEMCVSKPVKKRHRCMYIC